MIERLKDHKMKQGRGVTPRELVEGVLEHIDDVDEIVVATITNEGNVTTGYSIESGLHGIALIDLAKDTLKHDLRG